MVKAKTISTPRGDAILSHLCGVKCWDAGTDTPDIMPPTLCAYAGAEFEQGGENGEVMGSTLCGLWTGIQWENVVHPDSRMLEQAFKDHVFTQNDLHLPGMWAIAKGVGGSNVGHVFGVDGTDSESLTKGMVEARKRMQEYRRYYREYLSGFEDAELVCSAPQLHSGKPQGGVRLSPGAAGFLGSGCFPR